MSGTDSIKQSGSASLNRDVTNEMKKATKIGTIWLLLMDNLLYLLRLLVEAGGVEPWKSQ